MCKQIILSSKYSHIIFVRNKSNEIEDNAMQNTVLRTVWS